MNLCKITGARDAEFFMRRSATCKAALKLRRSRVSFLTMCRRALMRRHSTCSTSVGISLKLETLVPLVRNSVSMNTN